ncbi:hypothetical protein CBOM_05233 [Ceraceosorus bombacis]|uniref:Uncharacterized protein n=1 Tax=Ceraceosorus bombacis TaxID=401625 RepID=A0A0P1BRE0_9BASI|nr:hypothetical protein CBOM_05233 [Ceraceosorus bombacis]
MGVLCNNVKSVLLRLWNPDLLLPGQIREHAHNVTTVLAEAAVSDVNVYLLPFQAWQCKTRGP